jgi:hypothetical protein
MEEEFDNFQWINDFRHKIVKIPFGNNFCRKILDQELIQQFREKTEQTIVDGLNTMGKLSSKSSIIGGFPGSLAVAVLRKNLKELSELPYKILLKTDGQRFFLCFVSVDNKQSKKENICYLINRSNEYFILGIYGFPAKIYEGTILDGELVQTKKGIYQFQIFDCLLFEGNGVMQLTHNKRMEYSKKIISYLNIDTSNQINLNPFDIIYKEYCTIEQAIEVKTGSSNLDYDTDGLILIDISREYVFGKDLKLFKLKFLHTVDFLTEMKKDNNNNWEYSFYTFSKHNRRKIQETGITTKDWFKYFQDTSHNYVKNDLSALDGMILECRLDKESQKWFPYRIRNDKNHANNEETLRLTNQNIQEDIQFKEIISILNNSTKKNIQ